MQVNVLYRDDDLLAVDKPAHLLVHRGWGRDPVVLVDIVKEMLAQSKVYPLHRLDRQTSGVVLFARSRETASRFQRAFEHGAVLKSYWALVRGVPPPQGTIDHPIPRKAKGPRVAAVTSFRLIETLEIAPRHVSWIEVRPRTGRLHQVRRHLKHISHPVIGDANYGKGPINRALKEQFGLGRMALHAASLGFDHPTTGAPVVIRAALPEDLAAPLRRMGLSAKHLEPPR
jgi:tRNA pseudouridine65 synthase